MSESKQHEKVTLKAQVENGNEIPLRLEVFNFCMRTSAQKYKNIFGSNNTNSSTGMAANMTRPPSD